MSEAAEVAGAAEGVPAVAYRFAAGGQVDSDSHGMVDLAFRWSRPGRSFTASLLTDTVDLRWQREGDTGRGWFAIRGEAGAAGLMITPWRDGGPDPERALGAYYGGVEAGAVRYGPLGTYVGAESSAMVWGFTAKPGQPVPVTTPVTQFGLLLGRWSPTAEITLRGGFQAIAAGVETGEPLVPLRLEAYARVAPDWVIAPRAEVRAGWLSTADSISAFRIGGLTPYGVPMAGAAWAEWWAMSYLAARVGPELHVKGAWPIRFALVADVVRADVLYGQGPEGIGLGVLSHVAHKAWFGELNLGYGLGLQRQPGVSPAALWFAVGRDWSALGRRKATSAP